jgi:hypothetical protein
MSEGLHEPPLLGRVVEDEYGRHCGLSRLIGGPIVFKLELDPRSDSSPDALRKPLFPRVGCRYGERCGFSWLIGPIVSKLELEPPMSESSPREDDVLRKPLFL